MDVLIEKHVNERDLSLYTSPELVVCLVHQAQSPVASPRHQRPIDGYRIPLEPFRIVDRRDIWTGKPAARRASESENCQALGDVPVTPEAGMDHSQGTSGPFIVARETFGEEELHDRRSGGGFHPDE